MTIKTCIWCANPCDYYYELRPAIYNLFEQDASALRIATASNCKKYVCGLK